jgi:acyl carrier protein phosphodiesterase
MNFLAHTYLAWSSGNDEEFIIGSFIADHVKGNDTGRFRPGFMKGIVFHRNIDMYTDQHPQFIRSRSRLIGQYHKYSGVITDMFYDHLLATNWKDYSHEDIYDFTARNYKLLLKYFLTLPPKTKRLLPFMIQSNWLASYAHFDFLQRSLEGMAMRTPFKSNMENAVIDLKRDYSLFTKEFRLFFPEIIEYAKLIKL